jgi:alpha/beta superfamily hydrolase
MSASARGARAVWRGPRQIRARAIDGAEHFFAGYVVEFARLLADWVTKLS